MTGLELQGEGAGEAIAARLAEVRRVVARHLPDAEIEHVGATSVPGCLTKGDLDVVARVDGADLARCAAALDGALARSARNEATDEYVEYDLHLDDGSSASVQLVARGGWHDRRFTGFKRALLADPVLVRDYNDLKRRHAGRPMELYGEAKAGFVDAALGSDQSADAGALPCPDDGRRA